MRAAHAVPARPRPDRPQQGVPAPEAQDAGVRRARGRPLPHAPHAHARGDPGLAHRRARAGAQRGPRRGDRARARPRPPAVRPHRRGRARRLPRASASGRAFRHHEHSLRVVDTARARRRRPQPDRAGARRDPRPLRPRAAAGARSRAGSCGWSTASPTSTTTSTTPCAPACCTRATCPPEPIAMLGDTGPQRIDALVHDLVEHSERGRRHRAGREVGAAMAALRDVHVRARLPRARRRAREHAKIDRVVRTLFDHYCAHPDEIPPSIPAPTLPDARDRLPRRHDRPLLHPPFEALSVPRASRRNRRWTTDGPLHRRLEERVRDAVDMVALVSARTELRRAGVNSYFGRLPVPRRAHRLLPRAARTRSSTTASAARPRATRSRS